ncbi:hypothetical protein DFH06DRAFT_1306555 [Mycena polygramma]|nr:hypothetical protein DFH06DRAFT_1306555 [Mycena polygramma]
MHLPKFGALPTDPQGKEALDLYVASGARHFKLLNSNEPPDDSETAFIRSVISTADASVAHLNEKISKLQAQLKHLEDERASFLSYRARNSAILSPLRRMPPEVLGEIFVWTLPSPAAPLVCRKFRMGASPWVLTQISSRWRKFSFSTPPLWSQIAVDYTVPSVLPSELVAAQIERSQKLKIHFYGRSEANSQPQIELFQLLAQHSSRWEELSIGLTSAITAPSLVEVGVYNEFHFLTTAFPIHQLTRYQLDGPWVTHREILNLAPNLIEARIHIDFDDDPWPEQDEVVNLHHIRRLYASDAGVLRFLRVPALEELAIWAPRDDVSPLAANLESLVNRSACPLRRLGLRGYPNADVTSKILQGCSFITELVILATDSDAEKEVNALLTTLTVPILPGSTVTAPQLRFIVFGCEDDSHVDDTLFLGMVKSRWDAEDCALKSATLLVESGPGPDPTMLDSFRALRQEGLDLLLLLNVEGGDEITRLAYGTTWI